MIMISIFSVLVLICSDPGRLAEQKNVNLLWQLMEISTFPCMNYN